MLNPDGLDIDIRPNVVCSNFILMCSCINTVNYNTNPIYLDDSVDPAFLCK